MRITLFAIGALMVLIGIGAFMQAVHRFDRRGDTGFMRHGGVALLLAIGGGALMAVILALEWWR